MIPVLDQTFTGFASNSSSIVISNVSTTVPNELILIFVSTGRSGGSFNSTGANGGGLNWGIFSGLNGSTGTQQLECWAAFAPTVLTNQTITINFAGINASMSASISTWKNVRTTGNLADSCVVSFQKQAGSGTTFTKTETSRSANGLIVYGVATANNITVTAGSGQTKQQTVSENTGASSQIALITQNSSNSQSQAIVCNGTLSPSAGYAMGAVELLSVDSTTVFKGMIANKFSNGSFATTNLTIGTLQGTGGADMFEVPVGSKVVLVIGVGSNGQSVTVSDISGNTWSPIKSTQFTGRQIEVWQCENVTTRMQHGDTITVSWTSTVGFCILGFVIYGCSPSGSVDLNLFTTGHTNAPASPVGAQVQSNELFLGIGMQSGDTNAITALTPAGGFLTTNFPGDNTGLHTSNSAMNVYAYFAYSPPPITQFTGTYVASEFWAMGIISFTQNVTSVGTITDLFSPTDPTTVTLSGLLSLVGTPSAVGLVHTPNPAITQPTLTTHGVINSPMPSFSNVFSVTLTNLIPGITYYYGVYITDSSGVTTYYVYGSFSTIAAIKKKRFYYKIYDPNLVYLTTWSTDVISDPSFRMVVNGGAGQLLVKLGRKYSSFGEGADVSLNNRVELWAMDCDAPQGVKIFTGYISGYAPTIDGQNQFVDVTVLGYATLLTAHVLTDQPTGDTSITYSNFDPAAILTDAIDKFHNDGGNNVFYTPTSIVKTNTSVSYVFINNTIQEVIDKVNQLTPQNWYWYIDANGIINMNYSNIAYPDHKVTIGKDLSYLSSNRRLEHIINAVSVIGGGTPTPLYNSYTRSTSVSSWGKRIDRINDSRVTDNTTADAMAKKELDLYQDPEYLTTLRVIDNNGDDQQKGANIEAFFPGQTLQVVNLTNAPILIIRSITYFYDHLEIEASTRLPEVAKDITSLASQILTTAQTDLPAAPTVRSV